MTSEVFPSDTYGIFEPVQNPVQKIKTVEGRLWDSLKELAVTEANVHFMVTLHGLGLATNDVKSFAKKQHQHKRVNRALDFKVMKSAMKSKLPDAFAQAKKLRQQKNNLRTKLSKKYLGNKVKCKRINENMVLRYRQLKKSEIEKANRRIQFIKEKNVLEK